MNLNALIEHLRQLVTEKPQLDCGRLPVRLVFGPLSGGSSELRTDQIVFNGNSIDIEVE